jgi:hypothetical protein
MSHLFEPILVGTLGLAAGILAFGTVAITLDALRAKVRARVVLHRAILADHKFEKTLVALDHSEKMSPEEISVIIKELETRLSELSARDQAYIRQGLHQASPKGVQRFAKELATAY